MGTTNDIQIFVLDGMKVNECVTENADGSYTILVNADLCQEKQQAAVEHALKHIQGNDFEKNDVQQIESIVHEEVLGYGNS